MSLITGRFRVDKMPTLGLASTLQLLLSLAYVTYYSKPMKLILSFMYDKPTTVALQVVVATELCEL
jgi:hypothetical protein